MSIESTGAGLSEKQHTLFKLRTLAATTVTDVGCTEVSPLATSHWSGKKMTELDGSCTRHSHIMQDIRHGNLATERQAETEGITNLQLDCHHSTGLFHEPHGDEPRSAVKGGFQGHCFGLHLQTIRTRGEKGFFMSGSWLFRIAVKHCETQNIRYG